MTATPRGWRVAVKQGDVLSVHGTYDTRGPPGTRPWRSCPWPRRGGRPAARTPSARTSRCAGVLTHGHLPENDHHGGEPAARTRARRRCPTGRGRTRSTSAASSTARATCRCPTRAATRPSSRPASRSQFVNRDAGTRHLPHDHRLPAAVLRRSTGIAFPLANGSIFDSGELGFGPAAFTPAANRISWSTPATSRPAPTRTSAASTRSCGVRSASRADPWTSASSSRTTTPRPACSPSGPRERGHAGDHAARGRDRRRAVARPDALRRVIARSGPSSRSSARTTRGSRRRSRSCARRTSAASPSSACASAARRSPPRSAARCTGPRRPRSAGSTSSRSTAPRSRPGPWFAWHNDTFTLPPGADAARAQRVLPARVPRRAQHRAAVPPRGHAGDRRGLDPRRPRHAVPRAASTATPSAPRPARTRPTTASPVLRAVRPRSPPPGRTIDGQRPNLGGRTEATGGGRPDEGAMFSRRHAATSWLAAVAALAAPAGAQATPRTRVPRRRRRPGRGQPHPGRPATLCLLNDERAPPVCTR